MIKSFLKKIYYSYRNTSYSQAGEDAIMQFLFNDKGKRGAISYLDVGTNIPNYSNNTYWFYKRGGRGVCVEADPTLIKKIKNVRSRDKVINAGVTTSDQKEADFYVFNIASISTFSKEEAEARNKSGVNKVEKVVKVPLININDLLEQNFNACPDVLSLDIEGLDLDVLKSLNFESFPIPVLCVETCTYSENHIRPKDHSIAEFLATKNYELYADTYINSIFVNKNWFYNK